MDIIKLANGTIMTVIDSEGGNVGRGMNLDFCFEPVSENQPLNDWLEYCKTTKEPIIPFVEYFAKYYIPIEDLEEAEYTNTFELSEFETCVSKKVDDFLDTYPLKSKRNLLFMDSYHFEEMQHLLIDGKYRGFEVRHRKDMPSGYLWATPFENWNGDI